MSRSLTRASNAVWELRLGVETRGRIGIDYPDGHHYASMNYSTIYRVLDFLDLRPDDVFIDIGGGKGRVMCCAARYRIARVVGVEQSPEFCAQARLNAARTRGRKAPIEVYEGGAEEYDYASGSVLFLFDPFGRETLTRVLAKVRDDRAGRPVRIAYANPTHRAAFDDHPWLQRYAFWDSAGLGLEHSVEFYRTRT